jgi:hypothetical protein
MSNIITYSGIIEFEPEHVTNKHLAQAVWKKVAMVKFDGEIAEYYAWFLNRKFNLNLNKNLRGSHVTFINDNYHRDSHFIHLTDEEREEIWESVKLKWDNQTIDVVINTDFHTNGLHWWLNVDYEHRESLHAIRRELGLSYPNSGLHMTIGHANERNREFSQYLHRLYLNEQIELNDSLQWKKNLA